MLLDDKNEEDGVNDADIDGNSNNGDLPGAEPLAPKPALLEAVQGQAAKAGRQYLQILPSETFQPQVGGTCHCCVRHESV